MAVHKLRAHTGRWGSELLRFKISVLSVLGERIAPPELVIGLAGTVEKASEMLPMPQPLSYDRIRREIHKHKVSTSVVTLQKYMGNKSDIQAIVLIAPVLT